jgi:hypothetical protein
MKWIYYDYKRYNKETNFNNRRHCTIKKNIFPNKIDKTIEIVIVPKLADITVNQQNVGIVLDEKSILRFYLSVIEMSQLPRSILKMI